MDDFDEPEDWLSKICQSCKHPADDHAAGECGGDVEPGKQCPCPRLNLNRGGDGRTMSYHVTFGPAGDLIASTHLSEVPAHSPYKPGDWVVMHGFDGAPPWHRTGWRGFVLGSLGSTLLRGLTEDGQEWAEYWGALQPDSTPGFDNRCNCCPHPPTSPPPTQLSLFDLPDSPVLTGQVSV